jgi:glutaconate CoA-transferase subunit B
MENIEMTFTASELMTVNAARLLRDGDVVFVGVGIPNLACNLAQRTHAPGLVMVYEAGVIGARPSRLPLSIGDPTLVSGSSAVCSMYDIFAMYLQRGNIDVGFLGGAQVPAGIFPRLFDGRARVQSGENELAVLIGFHNPQVGNDRLRAFAAQAGRFPFAVPGDEPGGCAEIDRFGKAAFLVGRHDIAAGGPGGDFHRAAGAGEASLGMRIVANHRGVDIAIAVDLRAAGELRLTQPPTPEEIRILREELDPQGIYLKG